MIVIFEKKTTQSKDPLYGEDCIVGMDNRPDRMIFFKLFEHPELSYSIYVDDINDTSLYEYFKFYNDLYHQNGLDGNVMFCNKRTMFMNEYPIEDYVDLKTIENVMKKVKR